MSDEPRISETSAAREAVLDQLAARYEHFAEKEQKLRAKGDEVKAEGAHQYALWILRAYQAEADVT